MDQLYKRITEIRSILNPTFAEDNRITKRERIKNLLEVEDNLLEELAELEEEYAAMLVASQRGSLSA